MAERAAAPTGVARAVPILHWARNYPRPNLRGDLVAGLTVAVMLVPQGMAYANLAGMPPVTGLYAAIVGIVAYALLGTSGSLAVGPVAITSLLTLSCSRSSLRRTRRTPLSQRCSPSRSAPCSWSQDCCAWGSS